MVRSGRPGARFWLWLRVWRRRLKLLIEVGGLVAAMFGGALKAWLLLKARDVGRPDAPPGNDMATLATDRVPRPPATK